MSKARPKRGKPGAAELLEQQLNTYRAIVAAAARGERLRPDQCDELRIVMLTLRLPGYAFRRDVRAVAGAETAGLYRRLELAAFHPHLFTPAEWLRQRLPQ